LTLASVRTEIITIIKDDPAGSEILLLKKAALAFQPSKQKHGSSLTFYPLTCHIDYWLG